MNTPRIALVHDRLDQFGGAERVLKALHSLYPQSDIFTSVYKPNKRLEYFEQLKIQTTFLQKVPSQGVFSKFATPMMPMAFESLDVRSYDIIVSSTSHFAKGVITTPEQLHICYCHTPPRFLYHYATETPYRTKGILKPFVHTLDHNLRQYDYVAAQRPDYFITNSENTKKRIEKFYKRNAVVIHPPVDVAHIIPQSGINKEDYYLVVSRLVTYKNVQTVVEAFNKNNKKLLVAGTGNQMDHLKSIAKNNITFLGFVPDEDLPQLYQKARAFIFPTEDEDFGITPLEALAAGTPVIAHNSGGITETMIQGQTGILYNENNVTALNTAINDFETVATDIDAEFLIQHAQQFTKEVFKTKIKAFIEDKYKELHKNNAL